MARTTTKKLQSEMKLCCILHYQCKWWSWLSGFSVVRLLVSVFDHPLSVCLYVCQTITFENP